MALDIYPRFSPFRLQGFGLVRVEGEHMSDERFWTVTWPLADVAHEFILVSQQHSKPMDYAAHFCAWLHKSWASVRPFGRLSLLFSKVVAIAWPIARFSLPKVRYTYPSSDQYSSGVAAGRWKRFMCQSYTFALQQTSGFCLLMVLFPMKGSF